MWIPFLARWGEKSGRMGPRHRGFPGCACKFRHLQKTSAADGNAKLVKTKDNVPRSGLEMSVLGGGPKNSEGDGGGNRCRTPGGIHIRTQLEPRACDGLPKALATNRRTPERDPAALLHRQPNTSRTSPTTLSFGNKEPGGHFQCRSLRRYLLIIAAHMQAVNPS